VDEDDSSSSTTSSDESLYALFVLLILIPPLAVLAYACSGTDFPSSQWKLYLTWRFAHSNPHVLLLYMPREARNNLRAELFKPREPAALPAATESATTGDKDDKEEVDDLKKEKEALQLAEAPGPSSSEDKAGAPGPSTSDEAGAPGPSTSDAPGTSDAPAPTSGKAPAPSPGSGKAKAPAAPPAGEAALGDETSEVPKGKAPAAGERVEKI
jgi:hypothetical protein